MTDRIAPGSLPPPTRTGSITWPAYRFDLLYDKIERGIVRRIVGRVASRAPDG